MSHASPTGHSPFTVPTPRPKAMTFPEAIIAVSAGERLTKLEWHDSNTYIHLSEGRLKIHKSEDGKNYDLIVSDGDMLGTDWIVR